jgi:uncharacterized protein YegL
MRRDLTDITVVLDRSGSMETCRVEAQGGLNAFVEKQKAEPGEANFTLVQFDNEYECVHAGIPVKDVPELTIVPRGMTALHDALGRAINETGARLAATKEEDRPELVVFVVITDGHENASHEFKGQQIKEMIERQEKDYNWKFTYLGANQDAFATAGGLGVTRAAAANYSVRKSDMAFAAAASNVARMRTTAASHGASEVKCAYTPEELASMS